MDLTQRQKKILNIIVEEYINSALPVSSQLLEKKFDFGVCPATIRTDMQKLSDKGYVQQPYTSAGRVPTDKGYRFFVDELLSQNSHNYDSSFLEEIKTMEENIQDSIRFAQNLMKKISEATSSLTISYFSEGEVFFKEGWGEIIREPEFEDSKFFSKFVDMVENLEENINDLKNETNPQSYIGKESPFPKARDFSVIVSRCLFPKNEKGVIAILGPKRMDYDRNISLLNSLTRLMENL